MLKYQDSFKAISPTQQFIDDAGFTHEYSRSEKQNISTEEVDLDSIWEQWLGWCRGTRNNPYTFQTFKNNLHDLGFAVIEHRPINKTSGKRNRNLFLIIDKPITAVDGDSL